MMSNDYRDVPPRPRSFLSTLAWGVSMAAVASILSLAGIILYGMNIADRKTDSLVGLTEAGLRNLPELRRSLPPALADMLNDVRSPDYRDQLEVTARLVMVPCRGAHRDQGTRERIRPVIEVRNRGKEVVSLLSIRVTVLNEDDMPIAASNEWAATPMAIDEKWCGPLMPGATARIVGSPLPGDHRPPEKCRVEATITDVRLWNRNAASAAPEERPARPLKGPQAPATVRETPQPPPTRPEPPNSRR